MLNATFKLPYKSLIPNLNIKMERWHCVNCENRISVEEEKCPSCGYERTDYDLAGAAEDTGQYLINKLDLPDTKLEVVDLSILKVIIAVVIGVGFGGIVILLLRYFFK